VSAPAILDIGALLEALVEADVEFVVIGGVAAIIHGAPLVTLDLDVVYQKEAGNIERLSGLLEALGSKVRDPAGRDLTPTHSQLAAGGQLLLSTTLGPLDLLGSLHDGRSFEELLPLTEMVEHEGLRFRVLGLRTLIEVKAAAGRMKDRLVLPLLLSLLEE
jgi:predicted nucleotidyltransferase